MLEDYSFRGRRWKTQNWEGKAERGTPKNEGDCLALGREKQSQWIQLQTTHAAQRQTRSQLRKSLQRAQHYQRLSL